MKNIILLALLGNISALKLRDDYLNLPPIVDQSDLDN